QNASAIANAAMNSPSAIAPSVVGALTAASQQGASLADLSDIAGQFGVSTSGVFGQFTGQEMQNIPAPQSDPRIGPTFPPPPPEPAGDFAMPEQTAGNFDPFGMPAQTTDMPAQTAGNFDPFAMPASAAFAQGNLPEAGPGAFAAPET